MSLKALLIAWHYRGSIIYVSLSNLICLTELRGSLGCITLFRLMRCTRVTIQNGTEGKYSYKLDRKISTNYQYLEYLLIRLNF